jgi:hypothetical protein
MPDTRHLVAFVRRLTSLRSRFPFLRQRRFLTHSAWPVPGCLWHGGSDAAVTVGCTEKARGHVVAEERDCRRVTTVCHCWSAAGIDAVFSVGERRLRAEA